MRLDLRNPRTLAEKVSWLEFNTDQALPATLSDKYAVRGYIEELGLGEILIPVCGGPWGRVDEISFEEITSPFVMKATHGSAMNYVCVNPRDMNERDLYQRAELWLSRPYSRAALEPHYLLIPRRVYCERLIGGMDEELVDFKIHCFNGVPRFVLVTSGRTTGLRLNLFDLDWKPMEGLRVGILQGEHVPRPSGLRRMLEIATLLSQDLPFTRVDLYDTSEGIFFGELTFSPAGGLFPYFTEELQRAYGKLLRIQHEPS